MKSISTILLFFSLTVNSVFAQLDFIYQNEKPPETFSHLKYDEIKMYYSWNDTSARIIDCYKHETINARVGIGVSVVFLVTGIIIATIKLEHDNSYATGAVNDLVNGFGIFIIATPGAIGLPVYIVFAQVYNRKNLYKELRSYYLNGKVNKKYLRN